MGFFQRLFGFGAPKVDARHLHIYVYSQRCAEGIAGSVDLFNELSAGEEGGEPWFVRKVLHTAGRGRCFDQVEVSLWLNARKQVVRHEVKGGMWLEPDEYERLRVARASTLEDDSPRGETALEIDETEMPGDNPNGR